MKLINLMLLSFLLILFSPLLCMDDLSQQLTDLQRSLGDLEGQLSGISAQSTSVAERTWTLNTDAAPDLITQLVVAIDDWQKGPVRSFPIEQIKQALPKIIDRELRRQEIELQSIVVPSNEQTVSEFKIVLKQILENYFTALIDKVDFNWCGCVKSGKRIALIIAVLQEIKQKRPDKNKRLVYTTLGAGGLMQDYLMLRALLQSGYKNIEVNIIDLMYPDAPLLSKLEQEQLAVVEKSEKPGEILTVAEQELLRDLPRTHDTFLLNKKRDVARIQTFTDLLKQYAAEQRAQIDITVYNQIYKYLEKITEPQELRRHIAQLEQIKASIDDQAKAQQLEQQIVRLREGLVKPREYPESERTDVLLMVDPGVGLSGIPAFPSQATAFNIRIKSRDGAPPFYLFVPRHQGVQLYEEPSYADNATVQVLKEQLLRAIEHTSAKDSYKPALVTQLHDRMMFPGIELTYFAEPHVEFQDLVVETLAPNPVVYTLVQENPVHFQLPGSPDTSKIRKIDVDAYKEEDVITPNVGTYLAQVGRRALSRQRYEYTKVPL